MLMCLEVMKGEFQKFSRLGGDKWLTLGKGLPGGEGDRKKVCLLKNTTYEKILTWFNVKIHEGYINIDVSKISIHLK